MYRRGVLDQIFTESGTGVSDQTIYQCQGTL